jgi:hypothetical protein
LRLATDEELRSQRTSRLDRRLAKDQLGLATGPLLALPEAEDHYVRTRGAHFSFCCVFFPVL